MIFDIFYDFQKQKISSSDKFMDLDFSINMFESEIFWSARHTDKNVVASGEYLDHLFRRIQQAIEDAEDIDVSFAHMFLKINFLTNLISVRFFWLSFHQVNYKKYARIPILSNNVIHYPTSSGFTLTVTIHAHSAVNFKLKGKVDTTEILNNPKSADVQLLVMPRCVLFFTKFIFMYEEGIGSQNPYHFLNWNFVRPWMFFALHFILNVQLCHNIFSGGYSCISRTYLGLDSGK